MSNVEVGLDEALYSRQLYVMGRDAQKRMAKADVLIVGLDGVGVEAAKNIILAGVKSVSLYDNTPTDYIDLSTQFYLSENDIGTSRAIVSGPKLAELNPYVPVSVLNGALTNESILKHSVVLLSALPEAEVVRITDVCHSNNIVVVVCNSAGVFGRIFCDFGEQFTVYDTNGETLPVCTIANISKSNPALVTVLADTRHQLSTGDVVMLTDIKGTKELNGREYKVTVMDPYSFRIPVDATNINYYNSGGYVQPVKQPIQMKFDSYSTSYYVPGDIVCDFNKYERANPLHVAFRYVCIYNVCI